ncbi:lipoprotein [Pseudomonadota bacterium]
MKRVLLYLMLLATLSGCATYPELDEQLVELKQQNKELVAELKETNEGLLKSRKTWMLACLLSLEKEREQTSH